jgi:hypothetical protein
MMDCSDFCSSRLTRSQRSHATGSINSLIASSTQARRSFGSIASNSQHRIENELRRVDSERAVVPDQLEPQVVQVELAALETAGAGRPPEIHTRHFIVQGGTVLLCEASGKLVAGRHELQRGQDPEEIARSMWTRKLTRTEAGGPINYPRHRYA